MPSAGGEAAGLGSERGVCCGFCGTANICPLLYGYGFALIIINNKSLFKIDLLFGGREVEPDQSEDHHL